MIYILIFVIIAGIALLQPKVIRQHQPFLLLLAAIIIVVFQGFRWRTGTDWENYYNFFLESDDWTKCISCGFEYGFSFLNYIVRNFTDSYTVLLTIESIINCIFLCLSAKTFSKENSVEILLIALTYSIFPIRQTIAISIIMYSYKFIVQRNLLKFILVVLLASSIHRTALIFLLAYYISYKRWSVVTIFSVFIFSLFAGFATEKVFGNILNIAVNTYDLFGDTTQTKLNQYVTDDVPEYAVMSLPRIVLSIANSLVFLLFFIFFRERSFKDNIAFNILFNFHWIGICINRLVWLAIPDFARLTSYFGMSDIFLLIMIVNSSRQKNRMIWMVLLLVYFSSKYLMTIYGQYSNLFLPYYSVFSNTQRTIVY